jgi:cell division protein FtsQ
MDRSVAGRPQTAGRMPPFGRLALPRLLSTGRRAVEAARPGLALLARRRRLRIALAAVVLALALLSAGWMLLRHSPLVAVQHVRVSGVHGPEARAIDAALTTAGRRMSTLDVRIGALRAAVAPFRVVRELHASASFPHGLRISVVEQLPVAALTVGSVRSAVAADGVVLGPALLRSSLPTLDGSFLPAPGGRLRSQAMLAPLAVLGAAPPSLARLVSRVFSGPKGLTVAMSSGLQAYFGDGSRPHAKWLSLARVLADPSSSGASYVDVRLPERPAAGFPAGTAPPSSGAASEASSTAEPAAGGESTVQALAAGLARNNPSTGSSPGGATSTSPSGAGSSSSSSEPSSTGGGEGSETGREESQRASPERGG